MDGRKLHEVWYLGVSQIECKCSAHSVERFICHHEDWIAHWIIELRIESITIANEMLVIRVWQCALRNIALHIARNPLSVISSRCLQSSVIGSGVWQCNCECGVSSLWVCVSIASLSGMQACYLGVSALHGVARITKLPHLPAVTVVIIASKRRGSL